MCAHFLARRIDHVPGHAWSDTSGSSFASSTAVMQVGCTRGYTSARMIYEVFHCICDVESPYPSVRAKNSAVSVVRISLRRFFAPTTVFHPSRLVGVASFRIHRKKSECIDGLRGIREMTNELYGNRKDLDLSFERTKLFSEK